MKLEMIIILYVIKLKYKLYLLLLQGIFSNRLCGIFIAVTFSGGVCSIDVLSWDRLERFKVFVSGYAFQCKPGSLTFSLLCLSVSILLCFIPFLYDMLSWSLIGFRVCGVGLGWIVIISISLEWITFIGFGIILSEN